MRLLFLFLLGALYSPHAFSHVFHVGENDGWTLKPSENYSHWAQRNRFQINDQLVFKYKKGDDSVLVVREEDYNKCNKKNPVQTLTLNDGDSKFKFHRSGPFFFISGHDQNCEMGQKLVIVVIADRRRHQPLSFAPSPSPAAKHSTPPSHSPSPSPSAKTPAHAPTFQPPSHPPSHVPSHSPVAKTPTHAPPVHPPSHTPSHAPSPSPVAKTPSHAPPVQPPSHSPSPSSKPTPPPSPSPTSKPPTHAPPVQPPSRTPSPPPPAPVSPPPSQGAPQPDTDSQEYPPVSLPPSLAPAPAPSSAPHFGGSLIFTAIIGVVATVFSAGINV